jgi:transposase
MILREVSMQIKALDRQGVPRAQIARRLGVSRQTVYNHLNRASSAPRSRKRRPSKLDPYRCQVTSSFTTLGNVQFYDPVLLL